MPIEANLSSLAAAYRVITNRLSSLPATFTLSEPDMSEMFGLQERRTIRFLE